MDIKNLQNSTFEGNASQPISHSLWEVITIATVSAIVSLVTVVGNVLVMLSFKVNSQLKTVNNYYLLSLAFADLIIGVLSMNLYTSYILMGYWALGSLACDLWLALDYVASNASVMNLLVISFDRYFSITRPLTYRAKRTPKRAAVMIGLAWLVSFVLWAPPILCWQYLGVETTAVEPDHCKIPFFSVPVITFGTAIAAFYIPVSVMTFLYCRIYRETERRTKDLTELQGRLTPAEDPPEGGAEPPKAVVRSCFGFAGECKGRKQASWSSSNQGNAPKSTAARSDDAWAKVDRVTSFASVTSFNSYTSSEEGEEEQPVARATSQGPFEGLRRGGNGPRTEDGRAAEGGYDKAAYFTSPQKTSGRKCISYKFAPKAKGCSLTKEVNKGPEAPPPCLPPDLQQTALNSYPASSASPKPTDSTLKSQITKRKRIVLIKEKKAAQTLSAILLAFILTWTPYNIMVLISTFCSSDCIPPSLWHLGYWLCYVNSTINPMCYALCNKTFQKTFRMLLLCQWRRKRGEDKLYWSGQNPAINSKIT